MRAHVVLPEELVREIDRVVGKRHRSRFIEAAIRDRLSRETLSVALTGSIGVLNPADYPEWSTPEKASAWVRAGRRLDEQRLARKLEGPGE